jgi:hypothetical protein
MFRRLPGLSPTIREKDRMIAGGMTLRMAVAVAAVCGQLISAVSASGMDNAYAYYAQWSNGVPSDPSFFPISVWLQSPPNAAAYRNAGINLFIGLWQGPTDSQLSEISAAGMPVICDQNATGLTNANKQIIRAWMHQDEPDNAQPLPGGGYGPPVEPSVIIQGYEAFRTNEPSRPVYLNLGQGVAWDGWYGRGVRTGHPEDYYEYVKGCDIASFDIYPVNASQAAVSGKLWYVAMGVDRLHVCTSNAKPVWCWIETTKIDSTSAAKPTPAQVKSEVWMALIHGADGIGYFCHSWTPSFDEAALLHDAAMLAAVSNLNGQIRSLAPVLNGPSITNLVTVVSTNPAVPIDFMVKQLGGTTYVFSVAMRPGATAGVFTLPFGSNAHVIGESRRIPIVGGTFTDSFTSYGVHLYRIDSIGDDDGDGMPDWWEVAHFGGTNVSHGARSDDADDDRFCDLDEYLAGTNPTNGASALMVSELVPRSTGALVKWQSVPGKVYAIEAAGSLVGEWSAAREHVVAAPPTNEYPPAETLPDRAFHRVSVKAIVP